MESEMGVAFEADRDRRDEAVQAYFERFAKALTEGDAATIATMWQTPSYVMGAGMAQAVESSKEVEVFFSGAKEQYRRRGIVEARPEIESLAWLTERIALVQVRWPYLNAKKEEIGGERSTYVLNRLETGRLLMRVVVMHGTFESDA